MKVNRGALAPRPSEYFTIMPDAAATSDLLRGGRFIFRTRLMIDVVGAVLIWVRWSELGGPAHGFRD